MPVNRLLSLCLLFAFAFSACARSKEVEGGPLDAAFLSDDESLLIVFKRSGNVEFLAPMGSGVCVLLGAGSYDADRLIDHEGTIYDYFIEDDNLHLDDSTHDLLTGVYKRASVRELCVARQPDAGENGSSVRDLPLSEIEGEGAIRKRSAEIEIDDETIAFSIYLFGREVGHGARASALFAPDGGNLLDELPDIAFCDLGFCALMLPRNEAIPVEPGRYRLEISGTPEQLEEIDARLAERKGALFERTRIPLRVIVASTAITNAEINETVAGIVNAFEAAPYTLELVPSGVVRADAKFAELMPDFRSEEVEEFFAAGRADALNLFLIDRAIGIPGLLGLASGIPSSIGVRGPFNGVLVAVETHRTGAGDLSTEVLADSASHELAHALGLFHTTEEDGQLHDPIADTPECLPEHDLNGDGTLTAKECEHLDGFNMLFWTPVYEDGVFAKQDEISIEQADVLRHAIIGVE